MRLTEAGKWRACAVAVSLVLAAAPALFVSDSAAQTTTRRATTATRNGSRAPRRAGATTNPARALQPTPTPVRVPQLDPAGPPPQMPTPLPQPTKTPAQQPPADKPPADAIDDDEIITVTSNLVVVPVSVTDAAGQPVQGLKTADFKLDEEGRAQEIADVGAAEQVPLDIAILFDLSSSVSKRFEFEKQTVAGFLKQVMKAGDRAAVFAIRSEPEMIQALAPADAAAGKVLQLPPPPRLVPTAFYDAVNAASKYLATNAPGRHRRVVLVISDGDDNFSLRVREGEAEMARADLRGEEVKDSQRQRQEKLHRQVLGEVQREVQRADVVFYAINPSGGGLSLNQRGTRAQTGMQQLADATGGSAFVPQTLEELEPIFNRIAAELRAQYLIQYYSNSDAPAGKFLRIKVATPARPEARVRARQGYYSKKG